MQENVAVKPTDAQPAVANGQIWSKMPGVECVVSDAGSAAGVIVSDPRYRCIGIETPHGRVMVGERRQFKTRGGDIKTFTVGAVEDSGFVRSCEGPGYPADLVATWPIVSPLADATKDAARAQAQGIYDNGHSSRTLNINDIRAAAFGRSCDVMTLDGVTCPSAGWSVYQEAVRNAEREIVTAIIGSPLTRRRAIDKILADDARKYPAFAEARRAAAMAVCERPDGGHTPKHVHELLIRLRSYEDARGGMTEPRPLAFRALRELSEAADSPIALGTAYHAYERARGSAVSRVTAPAADHAARAKATRTMFPDPEQTITEAYGAK